MLGEPTLQSVFAHTLQFQGQQPFCMPMTLLAVVAVPARYEPQGERVRRPRPRMPGQMADLRAQLGDRELLAGEEQAWWCQRDNMHGMRPLPITWHCNCHFKQHVMPCSCPPCELGAVPRG